MRKGIIKAAAVAVVASIGLSGCLTMDQITSKQGIGTIIGGAAGAVGGAVLGGKVGGKMGQLVGVAAGTALGAWLGNEIGASLDKADKAALQDTAQTALSSRQVGQPVTWANPETGTVVETKVLSETGINPNAAPAPAPKKATKKKAAPVKVASTEPYCRTFEQKVTVDGKSEAHTGKACLDNGEWKVVTL